VISVRCSGSIYDSIIPFDFYTSIYEFFFHKNVCQGIDIFFF